MLIFYVKPLYVIALFALCPVVVSDDNKTIIKTPSFTNLAKMAWSSSGASNLELVNKLKESGVFHSNEVHRVMSEVDRIDFCTADEYKDAPQNIGHNATISAPHMHAIAIEGLLDVIRPNSHILDVGSGSGYLTTCFARLLGPEGVAVGIDHIDELVEQSTKNARKHHADLLDSGRLKFISGDGRKGYAEFGPYDAIHVGAAAAELPQALVDQLAIGGRMVIPVGTNSQKFLAIEKDKNGKTTERTLAHVVYIPLTEREIQTGRSNY